MKSLLIVIAVVFVISLNLTTSSWTVSPFKLPRNDALMAVGAYNGTIFLLGGWYHQEQLIQYDINKKTFIDYGKLVLPRSTSGYGQYWSQIDHIIYIIDKSGSYFNVFNMITNEYHENWNDVTFNITIGNRGCLASTSHYLFITGGLDTNALQILNLTTNEWLRDAPHMNEAHRRSHSCIVDFNYLWVFGGLYRTSNERISIINIVENNWHFIDPLTVELYGLRSVSWNHTIYVMGGRNTLDIVYFVDGDTGTVTVSPDSLPLSNAMAASIIVDKIIYLFGGCLADGDYTYDWMYYTLTSPSNHPTASPSDYPSTLPSLTPSAFPSMTPEIATTGVFILTKTDTKTDTSTPSSSTSFSTAAAVIISIVSTLVAVCLCYGIWMMCYRILTKRLSTKDVNNAIAENARNNADDVDDAKTVRNDDDHKDDVEQKEGRAQQYKDDVVVEDADSISNDSLYDDYNDGDQRDDVDTELHHDETMREIVKDKEPGVIQVNIRGENEYGEDIDDIYVKENTENESMRNGSKDDNECNVETAKGDDSNHAKSTEGQYYNDYYDEMHKNRI